MRSFPAYDGIIMTKMTGILAEVPRYQSRWRSRQLFMGTGEAYNALEPFRPIASRILDGRCREPIEQAENAYTEEEAARNGSVKFRKNHPTSMIS